APDDADAKARLEALRSAAAEVAPAGLHRFAIRTPERAHLLLVRGPDADDVDLRPAFEAAIAQVGGRGGGPPHRVQGAGPTPAAAPAALDAADAALPDVDAP
ncbi:MAG: DHHA1 domain-containing protein, partial [Trueperaceae bacterium]|nr:DHHA1 domain-containing protein [Trueperaceae bacterium]